MYRAARVDDQPPAMHLAPTICGWHDISGVRPCFAWAGRELAAGQGGAEGEGLGGGGDGIFGWARVRGIRDPVGDDA